MKKTEKEEKLSLRKREAYKGKKRKFVDKEKLHLENGSPKQTHFYKQSNKNSRKNMPQTEN